ncbi:transmembrane efflux protein [Kutzneria albida DSM 43870]|uniref:Transmembrane efflux protein n=1 Tax=Kutzneria albida DSM 43870 TaxID=1449976 RepID=W5VYW8_9PSEU|nr:transmembrane efflux protein [Kutzneria albida DSM 43870]
MQLHVDCAPVTTTATPVHAPAATETTRWSARTWGALFLLCGVLFLDGLDVSMVGVALPSIGTELGMTTSSLQWVVSGYVLGYGGFLLLGGRTADLLGRRSVLLVALGVFAFASLLGGIVDDPALLIAARFIKGVSAAFTAPAGLSIITTTFAEGPERNRALSIYTAFGASGFSSGLILGGLMTEVGWRWTFLLPVPVALVVLALGVKLIPNHPRPDVAHRGYDVGGAVTSTAALLLLVYTVVSAPEAGWTSPRTLGSFALVIALAVAFVLVERRVAHPLLRLGILRNRNVLAANLSAMAVFGSYIGFQFIGTMYLQSLLGWSPLGMALAFLPAGLIVAFGGPRTGALVNRFGAGRVVLAGLVAFVLGYALYLRIGLVPDYPAVILPSMLLIGLGFALAFPALNIQATTGVQDEEQGLASGLVQTSFQIGGAINLAVVTAVITVGAHATPSQVLASYGPALVLVTGVALAGLLISVALGALRRA